MKINNMNNVIEKSDDKVPQARWSDDQRLINAGFFLASFSFTLYFIVLTYEGLFTRYIADDFCYASQVIHQGFLQGFLNLYINWTGRYSQIIFTLLSSIPGHAFSSFLPLLLILGLSISLYCFYQQVFQIFNKNISKRNAILPSLATLFLFLLITPNRYQVLDWMISSVTYTSPIIGLLSLVAWLISLLRRTEVRKHWLTGIGIALLSFINAGFVETVAVLTITILGIFIIGSLLLLKNGRKWRAVRWQVLALVASIIGVVVNILSPGNAVRQEVLNVVRPSITELVGSTLRYSWDLLYGTIKSYPVPILVLMGLCIAIGFLSFGKLDSHSSTSLFKIYILPILLIPIGLFILVLSTMAPPIYFQSAFPADRTVSGAIFLLALSIGCGGLIIGHFLKILSIGFRPGLQQSLIVCAVLVVLMVGIYPIRAAIGTVPSVRKTIQYGMDWDLRHAMIREGVGQKQLSLVVPTIESLHGLKDINPDPTDWVNECVAEFYGLESIRSEY